MELLGAKTNRAIFLHFIEENADRLNSSTASVGNQIIKTRRAGRDVVDQPASLETMEALRLAVAGHALAVVERDGTSDPATGRVLTGSWLWDSSLVLTAHLAADSHARRSLLGATVVELGAGDTGLPGIAAVACLGAARCVLTDVAALLPGLRANADANGLGAARADVRELRWGDRLRLEDEEERVGVVLLSDVFYDPEDMPAMAATLRGMWWTDGDKDEDDGGGGGGDGTVGWAASEVRDSVLDCMDVLREHGFEVAEVDRVAKPLMRDPEQTAAFAVYRISLRRGDNETGVDFGCSLSC